MNSGGQFLREIGRNPRSILTTPRADLGDDRPDRPDTVQRLSDELVCDVGTIKIGRVDMVHLARDGLPQNSDRSLNISEEAPKPVFFRLARRVALLFSPCGSSGQGRAVEGEMPASSNSVNHSAPPETVGCF